MAYALFNGDRQIGPGLPNEAAVWKQALYSGLIPDVPVAGGQILPARYHVMEIREERCEPDPAWKLPDEIPDDAI
ncbi:hypothetical protein [Bradyrhizobium sp. AZCC 1693]|uniref:hypothetical protein n=1 Tax=Bradyrhizobium sp. AZCC 1693 TaxID=3117029 RepID=UPI002FF09B93